MSQVLTIVGASVRAAAWSAMRAGYAVRVGDMFADVDLPDACQATRVVDYPRGLTRVVRGPQQGPWMYTGALEDHPRLVRRLESIRPLLGNSAQVLNRVRNPQRVAEALRSAGISCPEVAAGDAKIPRNGTWVRKPLRSAGGMRISRCEESAKPAPSAPDELYYQKYIDGLPCSAVYVAARGQAVLLGVTRQLIGTAWTGGDAFRYCGSIAPLAVSPADLAAFVQIGDSLAAAFGLIGLFGVDAIVNPQGVWPVEINPRYTASVEVLERACGIAAIGMHVAACELGRLPGEDASALPRAPSPCSLRERPSPARGEGGRSDVDDHLLGSTNPRVCGKAIVYATSEAFVASDLRQGSSDHPSGDWPALADIPAPGTTVEAGCPIVTVLAEGTDEPQVLDRLERQAVEVRAAIATAVAR